MGNPRDFFKQLRGIKWLIVGNCGIFNLKDLRIKQKCKLSGRWKMFRGVNAINIDAKGRMVMPTRYRERLQEENNSQIVMTIDTEERCLLLYPLRAWEIIESKLAQLPSFNAQARRIQRLLIGHATEVDLDNNGRILLSPLLREYAGLMKHAVLIGQGKKFELWDEKHWQECREKWLAEEACLDEADLPDEVKSLSL
jgi:transcriptional regulator MraZ